MTILKSLMLLLIFSSFSLAYPGCNEGDPCVVGDGIACLGSIPPYPPGPCPANCQAPINALGQNCSGFPSPSTVFVGSCNPGYAGECHFDGLRCQDGLWTSSNLQGCCCPSGPVPLCLHNNSCALVNGVSNDQGVGPGVCSCMPQPSPIIVTPGCQGENSACGGPAPGMGFCCGGLDCVFSGPPGLAPGTCTAPVPALTSCTSDGSCNAIAPTCGITTFGVDNCGTPCSKTGGMCPAPPPPPPPPCAIGTICGKVTDAETGSVRLKSIPVELRDVSGVVRQTALTADTGRYHFTVLPGNYFVTPVANRTEASIYSQSLHAPGETVDIGMRFVPAQVVIDGPVGSFVMLSTGAWNNIWAPSMGLGQTINVLSRTVDLDSHAHLSPPANRIWYVTCWTMDVNHQWQKGTSTPLNGGNPMTPQQSYTGSCL